MQGSRVFLDHKGESPDRIAGALLNRTPVRLRWLTSPELTPSQSAEHGDGALDPAHGVFALILGELGQLTVIEAGEFFGAGLGLDYV